MFLNFKIILADAWLQEKGKGVIVPYFGIANFSQTDSKTGGTTDNYITQYQYSIYTEYGLHERITIGGKLFLMQNFLSNDPYIISNYKQSNYGVDFAEFFFRTKIFSTEKSILSAVILFKTPSFYSSTIGLPEFAKTNDAYEMRLEFGYNFGSSNDNLQIYNTKSDFIILSAGYRYNRGYDFNETRFELLYGNFVIPSLLVMFRFQKFVYLYNDTITIFQRNGRFNADSLMIFNTSGFAKWTLSFATKLTANATLEWGFYGSIVDKFINTNKKNINLYGIFTSIWIDF